jgi:hypothetical protein
MGLPALTLPTELSETWCDVIEGIELSIQNESSKEQRASSSRRFSETLYRISAAGTEIRVLEIKPVSSTALPPEDSVTTIVFMPCSRKDQGLVALVSNALKAKGAFPCGQAANRE